MKRTTLLTLFLDMKKRIAYPTRNLKLRNPGFTTIFLQLDLYFEPQYDSEVRPALGKKLWECMLPKADGAVFTAPNYDDTINDILVIW